MDGERRTLRGGHDGSISIPISSPRGPVSGFLPRYTVGAQTHPSASASGPGPGPGSGSAPMPISIPRDIPVRPRQGSSAQSPMNHPRRPADSGPRTPTSAASPMTDYFGRYATQYPPHSGPSDREHFPERAPPRQRDHLPSPRGGPPPLSSSAAAATSYAYMDRDSAVNRTSWDGSPVPSSPARTTRRSSHYSNTTGRRGSLLNHENAMAGISRHHAALADVTSSQPPTTPTSASSHRHDSFMNPDLPSPVERRQSLQYPPPEPSATRPRHPTALQQQDHFYHQQHSHPRQHHHQHHSSISSDPQSAYYDNQPYSERPPSSIGRPPSAAATNSSSSETIQASLTDLDYLHPTIKLGLRSNIQVKRVSDVLLGQLKLSPNEHTVSLFENCTRLMPNDRLPDNTVLYYRLDDPGRNDDIPEIFICDTSNPRLIPRFNARIRRFEDQIARGISVGQLRSSVARTLNLSDPDCVCIEAYNGMRIGAIEGDDWLMWEIAQTWFCNRFRVYISPNQHAIVVRLAPSPRRYVIHYIKPSTTSAAAAARMDDTEADVDSRPVLTDTIKKKVIQDIIKGSDRSQQSAISVAPEALSLKKQTQEFERRIAWGSLVDISMPFNELSLFLEQEKWLFGKPSGRCNVCDEARFAHEFIRLTSGCDHNAEMCVSCANKWLKVELKSKMPEAIACPSCRQSLELVDAQKWAQPMLLGRFDHLLMSGLLSKMPRFRWCIEPDCGSGQFHISECAEMTCYGCQLRQCIKHGTDWHDGYTCEEFQEFKSKTKMLEDKESRVTIKKVTRKCPDCKSRIELDSGCAHITCPCGSQWCYDCGARWLVDPVTGNIRCMHEEDCIEQDVELDQEQDENEFHGQEPQRRRRLRQQPSHNRLRSQSRARSHNRTRSRSQGQGQIQTQGQGQARSRSRPRNQSRMRSRSRVRSRSRRRAGAPEEPEAHYDNKLVRRQRQYYEDANDGFDEDYDENYDDYDENYHYDDEEDGGGLDDDFAHEEPALSRSYVSRPRTPARNVPDFYAPYEAYNERQLSRSVGAVGRDRRMMSHEPRSREDRERIAQVYAAAANAEAASSSGGGSTGGSRWEVADGSVQGQRRGPERGLERGQRIRGQHYPPAVQRFDHAPRTRRGSMSRGGQFQGV